MAEPAPDSFIISPAPDRRVRHPGGALLQPGDRVTWSPYWARRLNDEDIVMGDSSSKKKER